MKVMIFEPISGGHHLHYVKVLTEGLLNLGAEVLWALPTGSLKTEEFQVHLAALSNRIAFTRSVPPLVTANFRGWRSASKVLLDLTSEVRPDRVMLPYTGGLPAALGSRLRPWPFHDVKLEGLVMRGAWAYPATTYRAAVQNRLNLRLLLRVPWDRLHILDPLVFAWLTDYRIWGYERCRLIPEPVESIARVPPEKARAQLGLPPDGRWLVVTGMQDRRKGSDLLLNAFVNSELPHDARLLLAGKASRDVIQQFEATKRCAEWGSRIFLLDRYLTDHEHDLALNAAEYMAAPHPRPVGSSGLLVRAAALGKPVLATDYGWVGWATQCFGLGRTVNVNEPAQYRNAITHFFDDPPTFGNERTSAFVDYHCQANQIAHWLTQTRLAMGIKHDGELRTWQSLNLSNTI